MIFKKKTKVFLLRHWVGNSTEHRDRVELVQIHF